MVHIINNPHALYFNGELIGIITNADPFPGGLGSIVEALNLEANADVDLVGLISLSDSNGPVSGFVEGLCLPESIPVFDEEGDEVKDVINDITDMIDEWDGGDGPKMNF